MQNYKTDNDIKILVIGCGKMGTSIVKGWLDSGVKGRQIYIIDPNISKLEEMQTHHGVNLFLEPKPLQHMIFDYVMLALKPQQIETSLGSYRECVNENTQLISVAAGVRCNALHKLLPKVSNVIRIMPNTPCLIQKGVLIGYASRPMSETSKEFCQTVFSPLGFFSWVEHEDLMNDVTSISGSGPAYLFQFIESFVNAAERTALPPALAKQLAIKTVLGAAELLASQDKDPAQLRQDVTSPKGTTEAGLRVLNEHEVLDNLMHDVIQAAKRRSEELGRLF